MPEETVLIQPLPVKRDEMGFWTHPAWPRDGDEDAIPMTWFAEHGLEALCFEMESDGPEGLFETWADEGLCDCTAWVPSNPAGDGWFIFSIHDTEDGPICVWVRHVPSLQHEIDAVAAGKDFCGACGDGCGSCKVDEESPSAIPSIPNNQHPTICIYHGNCADGFGAAWVVRRAMVGRDIEFFPATHGHRAPDVTGKKVIIVDFSYPLETLMVMAETAESVLVLDHHKTAQADLKEIPAAGPHHKYHQVAPRLHALFDMNRSGAGIAWDYFFLGEPRPALINHIEDRDLWLFKLDGTREIQASLFSFPYDFDVWDALFEGDIETMRAEGVAIERKHHKDVAELVGVAKRRMMIGGHDVPVANLPYTLTSDAGHLMSAGEPFAACYWDTPEGRSFSLRSSDAGEDVSAIARQYGGGGHRNAAGFRVPFGHILAI